MTGRGINRWGCGLRAMLCIGAVLVVFATGVARADGPTPSTESRTLQSKPEKRLKDESAPLRSSSDEPKLGGSVFQTVAALGAVIAIIVVLGVVVRRVARRGGGLMSALGPGGRAPSGLLEVLGRFPVARGTTLVLLKLDRRVLLLCQNTGKLGGGAGMSTLCEINDPEDVASILLKSRDEEGDSLAKKFQKVLSGAEGDASSVLDEPANRAITGPDSFELSKARTRPVASLKTRLTTMRQADRTALRTGGSR